MSVPTTNRYLDQLKRNHADDPEVYAVPAHLRKAEPVLTLAAPAVSDAIDLRSVRWMDGKARSRLGMKLNKTGITMPVVPFAAMDACWLRIGVLSNDPDVLFLQFTNKPEPQSIKRRAPASFGGKPVLVQLAALGWTEGEYELIEKTNGWIATKKRIR